MIHKVVYKSYIQTVVYTSYRIVGNFWGRKLHEFWGIGSIRESFLHENRWPHSHVICSAKQSTKVFSMNFLLSPIHQFSPSKVSHYIVYTSLLAYIYRLIQNTHMQFLAARSLWTIFFPAKYSIPLATCKHMSISCFVANLIYWHNNTTCT